jgi:hypothetical protein
LAEFIKRFAGILLGKHLDKSFFELMQGLLNDCFRLQITFKKIQLFLKTFGILQK